MAAKGKITHWKRNKGFGFITPDSGAKQVFAHISDFHPRKPDPKVGDLVSFNLSTDKQGRPCAVRVVRAGDSKPFGLANNGSVGIGVAIAFLVIVGLCVAFTELPPIVLAWYVGISIVAFVMYAWDKNSAQRGAWRTPESALHLASLLGGWPGALVAQQVLRHKSSKKEFRVIFWITVVVNVVIFLSLFSELGMQWVLSLQNQI